MVIIDSSESSSDEEDRRLRPLRRRSGEWSRSRVFDAAEKPEGSASTEFFFDLSNGHKISSYQTQNRTIHTSVGNLSGGTITEKQIARNIAHEMVSHTRSLEGFLSKIEQIPSQSLAAKKFHVGLQLINEYVQSIHDVAISNDNIDPSGVFPYTTHVPNAENYTKGWCHPFDCPDYFPLQPNIEANDILPKHKTRNVQDTGSQTNISGDVIPREASAALEFFQELIRNS